MNLCGHEIGINKPFFLIAGPCVIENEAITMHTASVLKDITDRLNIPFIFKCSIDKANRTSSKGFRGVGFWEGLRVLEKVRDEIGVPVLTDVHNTIESSLEAVARVADVLQTPAFLCRQTDFIKTVAAQGKPVNIKKGQFLAPWDMANVVEKARETGNENIMVCDRGTSFGYNTLVSDMRGLQVMRETGAPVVFDASHSTQQPGGLGGCSGGQREFIPLLARAAVASGVSGLFIETHPDPNKALCDGPNSLRLDDMEDLLTTLTAIDEIVKIEGI